MEDQTLFGRLGDHSQEGALPFHMPGHKRNTTLAPYLEALGAKLDVTEIPGFDDLHDPEGILKEAMEKAARLYGSEETYFLVNGSTGGLLAGIRAATRRGDKVLVARNCHKAVYHALELCDLEPVFLQPPSVSGFGCAGSLPVDWVGKALEEHADIRLVILTSPTYEGVLSDVRSICGLAHGRDIPVLVDEAHGAHLGLYEGFPQGAVAQGADLVIQSLHKTLPSLTQTGVLHRNGGLVSPAELRRQLGIFQTSSPSYLLLASIDGCVDLIRREKVALFPLWKERLRRFAVLAQGISKFAVLGYGKGREVLPEEVYALEPSKLVISTRGLALSGMELMERLRQRYHLQLEMALEDYAIAMTGMGDSVEMMEDLCKALVELEEEIGPAEEAAVEEKTMLPRRQMPLARAMEEAWEPLPLEQCGGRVSGEYIWAYPPGVPLIIPGEMVGPGLLERLRQMGKAGVNLIGTRGSVPDTLAVLKLTK